MLSYRHAFHAGNHADVLKHLVEIALLRYLNLKDKPYTYIDTHAGAGIYALDAEYARKNREYETGIAELWQQHELPPLVADYVALVRELNPDNELTIYPGSPWLADAISRNQDKLWLVELHPSDSEILQENFLDYHRRIHITIEDGFQALKALLPPHTRRGFVLMDPPYEHKSDYENVISALDESLKRFATGIFAVWYPLLSRRESQKLPDQLKALNIKSWLHVSMQIKKPAEDGMGMFGSGMFVINPPWTLHDTLKETLPWLTDVLAEDDTANYTLEQHTR
ncbi:MAG TPA: 23S rRNA (adenine(2030)-N(6))-methyltransferase RlmJ [Gammaproteobacteria bacterium]